MKIAQFSPTYAAQLAAGTSAIGTGTGGDVSGSLPGPITVVGIGGTPVDPLPAIATEYLDGTGHWTTPAGTGGSGFVTNIDGGKEVVDTIAASGASQTLDLSLGNVFDLTLTAACTLTFTGATAGVFCSFELFLRQDGTGGWATTWPGSVVWPGGSAPTLSTTPSTVQVLAFGTLDGGTVWYGFPSHGAGTALTIEDEGTPLATAADTLNFVGAGVVASGSGTTKTITIPGTGAGAMTPHPAIVQKKTGSGSLTLGATPTNGNTLLLIGGLNSASDTMSALTTTGVTWAKLQDYNAGSMSSTVWLGAVGAGAGTAVSWASSGGAIYATVIELVGAFSGTLVSANNRQASNVSPLYRLAGAGVEYIPSGSICRVILYMVAATAGATDVCYGGDDISPTTTGIALGCIASPGAAVYWFGCHGQWDGGLVSILEIA